MHIANIRSHVLIRRLLQIRLRQRSRHCEKLRDRQAERMERPEYLPTPVGCVAAIKSGKASSG